MAGSPPPRPFRAEAYRLADGLVLSPPRVDEAATLAAALAPIDPWARYGVTAAMLAPALTPAADGATRLLVRDEERQRPCAVIVVREPWLVGPYVQFLAVLPGHQGRGIGSDLLAWFEAEARADRARNAWICVSAFNHGARRLYTRAGFEPAATLGDLFQPGIDEILMRKRL